MENFFSLDNFLEDNSSSSMYSEGVEFINSLLIEATSTPTTKKTLWQRLKSFIKRAIDWCLNRIRAFIRWIRGNKGKSPTQVADETLKRSAKNKTSSKPQEIIQSAVKSLGGSDGDSKKVNISFDVIDDSHSSDSGAKSDQVDFTYNIAAAINKLAVDIYSDKFVIHPNRIKDLVDAQRQLPNAPTRPGVIPNQGRNDWGWSAALLIYHWIHTDRYGFDRLNRLADGIKKWVWNKDMVETLTLLSNAEQLKAQLDGYISVGNDLTLSLKDIDTVNTALRSLNEAIEEINFDDPASDGLGDKQKSSGTMQGSNVMNKMNRETAMKALNIIADTVLGLQIGINMLTGGMGNKYEISPEYIGTVTTLEDLDNFAKGCIITGIPSKYIAYNVYLVASPALRGQANQKRPLMGQTRVVFPCAARSSKAFDTDSVLKIALNQVGIRSNKAEASISKALSDKTSRPGRYITPVLDCGSSYSVIRMMAAKTDYSYDERNRIARTTVAPRFQEICDELNLGIDVQGDIHAGNIGKLGDNWVCIDYGFFLRK